MFNLLGYKTDKTLYEKAFVHKSFDPKNNNEQLEFLGDAVLSLIVAELLFIENPNLEEGFLSKKRATIVRRKHLNLVGKKIIPKKKIKTSLKNIPINIFGNTLEAIIGAIYLDKGIKQTRIFIKKNIYNSEFLTQLTDVDFKTPSFCVVPKSNLYSSLRSAYETLNDDYMEVPIYGKKGTCILYDTALFHTRLDGDGIKSRRTWHQYYARGGWINSRLPNQNYYLRAPSPTLTNWNLFPKRLVFNDDLKIRKYFSHWNASQCEWVVSNFDKEYRNLTVRGKF